MMTGCSKDAISDRLYTRALGLGGSSELTLYIQTFNEEGSFSGKGDTAEQALRSSEANEGRRIFTGHTELVCLDGSHTLEEVRQLLFTQGLSPACKVYFTNVRTFFQSEDSTRTLYSIRMSEQNGLIGETDLASTLNEWLGTGKTALLPSEGPEGTGMVFLHRDGSTVQLSQDAAKGMYWLRRSSKELTVTLSRDGAEYDVTILRTSLQKSVSDSGQVQYSLTVRTDNCPDAWQTILSETILGQCCAAVSEMQETHADVIGIEDLLTAEGEAFNPAQYPEILISVSVR